MTKRMIIMLIAVGLVFGAVFGMKWFGNKMMNDFMAKMPVPPATISLPLKILLFVLIDGWVLVSRALLSSYWT